MGLIIDPEYLKWLHGRDYILGTNEVVKNMPMAYDLLIDCTWPDAKWFIDIYMMGYNLLYHINNGDVRALTFFSISTRNREGIKNAAEKGNALAQAEYSLSLAINNPESLYWAKLSSEQDEPNGWHALGRYYNYYRNKIKARYCFERAYTLGNSESALSCAWTFDSVDPQYYVWMFRYRPFWGQPIHYRIKMSWHHMDTVCVYQIGQLLDKCSSELWDVPDTDIYMHAINYYNTCNDNTRAAIDMWTFISKRFGVCKDVRLLVANLLWNSRMQGLYESGRRIKKPKRV